MEWANVCLLHARQERDAAQAEVTALEAEYTRVYAARNAAIGRRNQLDALVNMLREVAAGDPVEEVPL